MEIRSDIIYVLIGFFCGLFMAYVLGAFDCEEKRRGRKISKRIWVCRECGAEFKQGEISKAVNPYLERCPKCGAFSWVPKELLEA
jgi:DNA-directed RNA polymerase subunit RPC12/RpoP